MASSSFYADAFCSSWGARRTFSRHFIVEGLVLSTGIQALKYISAGYVFFLFGMVMS